MDKDILIVGGGIGGLTAALALAQCGYRVRVLEATPEFGAIGYGIQLGPNVFHMFERLGLSDAVLRVSIVPRALVMLDALDGQEVAYVPTGESFEARFKHPYIVLHRIDLHHVLLDACKAFGAIELVPSTVATSFEDLGERVRVRSKDGRTFEAAAVLGADGLGSAIREQMLAEGAPHFIGYVAHRTIVPMERVPAGVGAMMSCCGVGRAFTSCTIPCGRKPCSTSWRCFAPRPMRRRATLPGTAPRSRGPTAILNLR